MKQSIASAPAKTWNRKNLPSDVERFKETQGQTTELLKQLPSAAVNLARRPSGIAILAIAVLATVGLVWYLANAD